MRFPGLSGEDREGRTHADRHRNSQPLGMHREPFLLLGRSESHEQQIRPRQTDAPDDLRVIHLQ